MHCKKLNFHESIFSTKTYALHRHFKRSNKSKNAPVASKQVEAFLKEVKITLIKQVNSFYNEKEIQDKKKKIITKSSQIKDLIDVLK